MHCRSANLPQRVGHSCVAGSCALSVQIICLCIHLQIKQAAFCDSHATATSLQHTKHIMQPSAETLLACTQQPLLMHITSRYMLLAPTHQRVASSVALIRATLLNIHVVANSDMFRLSTEILRSELSRPSAVQTEAVKYCARSYMSLAVAVIYCNCSSILPCLLSCCHKLAIACP